jgi:hypothetical protein
MNEAESAQNLSCPHSHQHKDPPQKKKTKEIICPTGHLNVQSLSIQLRAFGQPQLREFWRNNADFCFIKLQIILSLPARAVLSDFDLDVRFLESDTSDGTKIARNSQNAENVF